MAANQRISLREAAITDTARSVATSIAQAAKPGPVPTATGVSPIDGAAASVAGAVVANVAASSAELAPRSAEGLAKSEAALAQMKTQDTANASAIKAVPADMQAQPPAATPVSNPSAGIGGRTGSTSATEASLSRRDRPG
jgi:hypothetical protein